jgi:hypothetical protein
MILSDDIGQDNVRRLVTLTSRKDCCCCSWARYLDLGRARPRSGSNFAAVGGATIQEGSAGRCHAGTLPRPLNEPSERKTFGEGLYNDGLPSVWAGSATSYAQELRPNRPSICMALCYVTGSVVGGPATTFFSLSLRFFGATGARRWRPLSAVASESGLDFRAPEMLPTATTIGHRDSLSLTLYWNNYTVTLSHGLVDTRNLSSSWYPKDTISSDRDCRGRTRWHLLWCTRRRIYLPLGRPRESGTFCGVQGVGFTYR